MLQKTWFIRTMHTVNTPRVSPEMEENELPRYVLLLHTISGGTETPIYPAAVPTSSLRAPHHTAQGGQPGGDLTSNRFAHFCNWFSIAAKPAKIKGWGTRGERTRHWFAWHSLKHAICCVGQLGAFNGVTICLCYCCRSTRVSAAVAVAAAAQEKWCHWAPWCKMLIYSTFGQGWARSGAVKV